MYDFNSNKMRIFEATCKQHKPLVPVLEIFKSIEGEGIRAGKACTFVRFAGCNLNCSYCDTAYSHELTDEVKWMSVNDIVHQIRKLNCKDVTLTGGEPLLHPDACTEIIKLLPEFLFNIETNGSIDILKFRKGLSNVFYTMDCKCPTSKMPGTPYPDSLSESDVLKFVVGSANDLKFVHEFMVKHRPTAMVFIHPVFGSIELVEIAEFIKEYDYLNMRMGVQLHKIIWDPNLRGV